jgi:hypothetical protein
MVAVAADICEDPAAFEADVARPVDEPRRAARRQHPRRAEDSPLDVYSVIPHGCTKARSQGGWLDDVRQHPAMLERRGDAQANVLAVAKVLAYWADTMRPGRKRWETMMTRPTWDVIIATTGLARSVVAAHIKWLRENELLALVSGGTTPQFSPGILRTPGEAERNDAAVYVLCAPRHLRLIAVTNPDDLGYEHEHDGRDLDPQEDDDDIPQGTPTPTWAPRLVELNRTPPLSVGELKTPTQARGSETTRGRELEEQMRTGLRPDSPSQPNLDSPAGPPSGEPLWPVSSTPQGTQDRVAAAATLQVLNPVFSRISVRFVASLLREWHLAGWTIADIRHALDHKPDGTRWTYDADIRHVPGWTRHRLAAWQDTNGTPTASPTQRAAAARAWEAGHRAAAAAAQEAIETVPAAVIDTLGPVVTTEAARRLIDHAAVSWNTPAGSTANRRTKVPQPEAASAATDNPAGTGATPDRHPAVADQLAVIRARNAARKHARWH